MNETYVIKTNTGEYIGKFGYKVKSIFDAKLFRKNELTICDEMWSDWECKPIPFNEELKSILNDHKSTK